MRCEDCLNSRRMISENGYHSVCCLPRKEAMECFMGDKGRHTELDTEEDAEEC